MIRIESKNDCCGCGACAQQCPKGCIAMVEDEQGFRYPKVDLDLCVDCHLCEKVCPVINQSQSHEPVATYAAKNGNDTERMASSSGGVFIALAKRIIDEGGVVFGARFDDNWDVCHDYAETLDGVHSFQGSKYVQSRIGDTYRQAESFLREGRKVMFTGTPCQIAGLRLFLRKDYATQLLLVDIVCHVTPSPLVWRDYLKYITREKCVSVGVDAEHLKLSGISFRDKRLGWEKYGFSVRYNSLLCGNGKRDAELFFEPSYNNVFMRGFLKDIYLRPSCYSCPAKSAKSGSDITLADFWGVASPYPQLYDEGGVSLLLANTACGREFILSLSGVERHEVDFQSALKHNPSIAHCVKRPVQADTFWLRYPSEGIDCIVPIVSAMRPPLADRLKESLRRNVRRLFGDTLSRKIKSLIKH